MLPPIDFEFDGIKGKLFQLGVQQKKEEAIFVYGLVGLGEFAFCYRPHTNSHWMSFASPSVECMALCLKIARQQEKEQREFYTCPEHGPQEGVDTDGEKSYCRICDREVEVRVMQF